MSTVQTHQPDAIESADLGRNHAIKIISHSPLFYWWPVWLMGYVLALLTYLQGVTVSFEDHEKITDVIIHPSRALGVTYTVVTLMVMIMTNVPVRGAAWLTVITTILAVTFLFAFMGWWDNVLLAISGLAMYMNLGFYLFFSTAVFIVWVLAFAVFDRMDYWVFRPGQVVHERVLGGGERTYDTGGMSVYKLQDDLFRHWVLGLGSGDIHLATGGARNTEIVLPNVLFLHRKLDGIQRLIAMRPDETPDNITTIGGPG